MTNYVDKKLVCASKIILNSEKQVFLFSTPSSYRKILTKVWHTSNRTCGIYYREKTEQADQRVSYAEVAQNRHESIRMAYVEYCNTSFSFKVQPSYVSYDLSVSNTEIPVFENEKIVNETTQLYSVPVNYNVSSTELILINSNTPTVVDSTKGASLKSVLFTRVLDTNTYKYDGFLVALKETTYVKISFVFSSLSIERYICFSCDVFVAL